jgi:hypothetical protein
VWQCRILVDCRGAPAVADRVGKTIGTDHPLSVHFAEGGMLHCSALQIAVENGSFSASQTCHTTAHSFFYNKDLNRLVFSNMYFYGADLYTWTCE